MDPAQGGPAGHTEVLLRTRACSCAPGAGQSGPLRTAAHRTHSSWPKPWRIAWLQGLRARILSTWDQAATRPKIVQTFVLRFHIQTAGHRQGPGEGRGGAAAAGCAQAKGGPAAPRLRRQQQRPARGPEGAPTRCAGGRGAGGAVVGAGARGWQERSRSQGERRERPGAGAAASCRQQFGDALVRADALERCLQAARGGST